MPKLLIAVILAALLVACSGSDGGNSDEVLHLDGYDIAHRDAQLHARALLSSLGPLVASLCREYDDMTFSEAVAHSASKPTPEVASTPPRGATVKPGQAADQASKEGELKIYLEECKRLTK